MKTKTLYKVADYENNGYHDSYFYDVYWNGEKLIDFMTGATAYAGGGYPDNSKIVLMSEAPARVRNAFKKWACRRAAEAIHFGAVRDIESPKPAAIKSGDVLITTRNVKPRTSELIPSGTFGEVFWKGSFKPHFVRPDRENTRVGLALPNGEKIFVALSACRRPETPEPVGDIEKRMLKLFDAGEFNVEPLTCCKAWLSGSYLYPPLKKAA